MNLDAIYILWLREIKRFIRSKSRIIGSLAFPTLILIIIGTGLNSVFTMGKLSYIEFIAPGMIGMVLLFSSISFGIMVIWDRQFGFLKEMLVAPISRTSIVVGKALGGVTTSMFQALLFLIVCFAIGIKIPSPLMLLLLFLVMILIAVGFVLVGIAFSSRMKDFHGFSLIMNFVVMPIFFLSGAFFPLDKLPEWLKWFVYIDPLTYGVDALRFCMVNTSSFPIWINLLALIVFGLVATIIGTLLFKTTQL
ncbi:MAG: ABC transporter permease [Deltaproteobacteria bacterium]|jgi:ABC-2 type transport system permease protein|nr:ABC transporter permease [Deltaproteobacteria bacterium]NOQ86444.1 ABC transporter permease [Deltaproteobacteria bacterium]